MESVSELNCFKELKDQGLEAAGNFFESAVQSLLFQI